MAIGDDLGGKLLIALVGAFIAVFVKEQRDAMRTWDVLRATLLRSGRALMRCEAQMVENLVHVKALGAIVGAGQEPTFVQFNEVTTGWNLSSPSTWLSYTDALPPDRLSFLIAYLDYWHQLQERHALYRETVDALLTELGATQAGGTGLRRQEFASRLVDEARGLLIVVRKIRVIGGRAIVGQYSPLSDSDVARLEGGASAA
jgi:hypothetical protein